MNFKSNYVFLFALVSIFLAGCASTVPKKTSGPQIETVVVEAEGAGALTDDIAKSRQNAIGDA
ncbi:MAG: hypothetical protein AB1633_09290, partial [Elusimicrobiota bacterium]